MTKYDKKCTEITLFAIQTNTSAPCQRILLLESGSSGGCPPPPTFVESDEFSEILTYKRAKNSLFECKWGGGVCRKFESFVGNLEGFAPPSEKVNFRH
jgi:hypothetical protein